jgi:HSP20 family protein
MANERQSKQQTSERAQTGSAQQGDWQSSTQRTGGQASGGQTSGGYGQPWSSAARGTGSGGGGSLSTRRSLDPGFYGGYGRSPFSMMQRLSDEMDRLFESFGMGRGFPSLWGSSSGGFGAGQRGLPGGFQGLQSLWSPSVDVCESEGKFCVTVDLPGLKRDDVNVQVENDAIVIQGQRSDERTTDEQGYYQRERSYGGFHRVIPLPEGADAEQASATFSDGVLRIEMPAAQTSSRGRRLEIRDASASGTTTSSTATRTSEGGYVSSGGDASSGRS